MAKPSEVSVNLQELEQEEDRERSGAFGFETEKIFVRYVGPAVLCYARIRGKEKVLLFF